MDGARARVDGDGGCSPAPAQGDGGGPAQGDSGGPVRVEQQRVPHVRGMSTVALREEGDAQAADLLFLRRRN